MVEFLKVVDPLAYARDEWPPELFVECGLPGYSIPRVHAGLPRENEQIKCSFASAEAVFKHYVDKAFLSHYRGLAVPVSKPIVLFTWVMNDGLGDWTAQIEVARLLKRAFPDLTIHLITLVEEGTSRHLHCPGCVNHLLFYRGYEAASCPTHLLKLMREAALIIQIPTYYPHFKTLMQGVHKIDGGAPPRELLIGEYGFIDSEWFHPASGARCMGLHVLEKGILIQEELMTRTLARLPYYFAYLATKRGHAIYLHALCSQLKEQTSDITLYLCHIHHLISVLQEENFNDYNLREIVIIEDYNCSVIPIQAEGKRLILHHLRNQSPEEIATRMLESQNFVGCRGDRSFSEVVSAGQLFFYDAPHHARPFLQDLYLLAKDRLLAYPALLEYLDLMGDFSGAWKDIGQKIGALLGEPTLQAGMQKLNQLIQSEYSFNENLINLVTYELLHYFFPLMMENEERALAQFTSEKINFQELIQRPALFPRL